MRDVRTIKHVVSLLDIMVSGRPAISLVSTTTAVMLHKLMRCVGVYLRTRAPHQLITHAAVVGVAMAMAIATTNRAAAENTLSRQHQFIAAISSCTLLRRATTDERERVMGKQLIRGSLSVESPPDACWTRSG